MTDYITSPVKSSRRRINARHAVALAVALFALPIARPAQERTVVIDAARLIDGTGRPPVSPARIVVRGDRIVQAGPAGEVRSPEGAERVDLARHTVMPGLIDLHYHVEDDPRLALRQLANGVTSFRDPGQWVERFDELKRLIAADALPGPRLHLCGPHIDGERPAYPRDSIVARDPEEARQIATRALDAGANALKIYFRLPLASARAVVDVCRARGVPCTAHLEILDARDLLRAGLHGLEHITSFGTAIVPPQQAEAYRQAVLLDSAARRDGRYTLFAAANLEAPEARALYEVTRATRPFVDATLAVFEARPGDAPLKGSALPREARARGFTAMKQLTARLHKEGARLVVGGHSTVPHAARGEAPWREIELLVESGLSPMEALVAATRTGAAFLGRDAELGTLEPGKLADLIVLEEDPTADIRHIRTVTRVMVGGRWIARDRYLAF
jgi:imidazolonepropionase-like amidohydrolase